MGDAVHGLAVVNRLKDDDPSRHITWIAEPAAADVARHHPSVDRVVVFHKSRGLRGVLRLRRELRDARFDLVINPMRYGKSLFPTLLAGGDRVLGLDRHRARDFVWLASDERVPPRPWRHTQDVLLEFVEALGIAPEPVEWRYRLTPGERAERDRYFGALRGDGAAAGSPEADRRWSTAGPVGRRPVVALVLASGNPRKDWPAERYAALAERAERELAARVLLLGGPGSRDREVARVVTAAGTGSPAVELCTSVRRVAWLLDGSDVAVSPDTGPLHLAHALGVPVVGLFGHTNPWRVGPYRRFHDLVIDRYTDPGETPDPSRTEPRHGRMERIRVDDVLARIRAALACYGPTSDQRSSNIS